MDVATLKRGTAAPPPSPSSSARRPRCSPCRGRCLAAGTGGLARRMPAPPFAASWELVGSPGPAPHTGRTQEASCEGVRQEAQKRPSGPCPRRRDEVGLWSGVVPQASIKLVRMVTVPRRLRLAKRARNPHVC
jgi:hypothetical protein